MLDGLRYAPGGGTPPVQVPLTEYDTGRGFAVFPPPELPDGRGVLVTDEPIELLATSTIHGGQTLFIRIDDAGHYLQEDAHEQVIPPLLEFLA